MHLKTCCCGCKLRTGTLIIGSLNLTTGICYLILLIIALAHQPPSTIHRTSDVLPRDFDFDSSSITSETKSTSYFKFSINRTESENDLNSDGYTIQNYFYYSTISMNQLLVLLLVSVSVSVIAAILLIIGATKGCKWLMLPWIAKASLGLIGSIVYSIFHFAAYYKNINLFLAILVFLAGCALNVYLIMVVISYFEELRRKEDGKTDCEKFYSAAGHFTEAWSTRKEILK